MGIQDTTVSEQLQMDTKTNLEESKKGDTAVSSARAITAAACSRWQKPLAWERSGDPDYGVVKEEWPTTTVKGLAIYDWPQKAR